MQYLPQHNLAIVDVETTGGSSRYHRVIEIGILRVENGKVVKKFNSLINPECVVPSFITEITGIKNSDVEDAPLFMDMQDEILELFEDAIFVAHNVGFDYSFIQNEFARIDREFNVPRLCTVRLSRKLFKEHHHHDLSSIIRRMGLMCENRHRALDDAKVLWEFIKKIEAMGRGDELRTVMRQMITQPARPNVVFVDY